MATRGKSNDRSVSVAMERDAKFKKNNHNSQSVTERGSSKTIQQLNLTWKNLSS